MLKLLLLWSIVGASVDWKLFSILQQYSPEIAIIVAIESSFQPSATSNRHARGLMQITPIALLEVKNRIRSGELTDCIPVLFYTFDDMYDSRRNLLTGSCFLRYLRTRYDKEEHILAHYNGGGRAVRALVRRRPWKETKQYLLRYNLYKEALYVK